MEKITRLPLTSEGRVTEAFTPAFLNYRAVRTPPSVCSTVLASIAVSLLNTVSAPETYAGQLLDSTGNLIKIAPNVT